MWLDQRESTPNMNEASTFRIKTFPWQEKKLDVTVENISFTHRLQSLLYKSIECLGRQIFHFGLSYFMYEYNVNWAYTRKLKLTKTEIHLYKIALGILSYLTWWGYKQCTPASCDFVNNEPCRTKSYLCKVPIHIHTTNGYVI